MDAIRGILKKQGESDLQIDNSRKETFLRRDIEFKSQGVTCRGWLYTPDKGKPPFPCVITAMGAGYVKEFPIMAVHAEEFTSRGLATIVFDYRFFGASEGEPRAHLIPYEQIEDCRNAISLAETLPDVDPKRLGFCGISLGGAHALAMAAVDPRIRCTVSAIPMVDGYAFHKLSKGDQQFRELTDLLIEDRRKRFKDETYRGYIPNYSPPGQKVLCNCPEPEHYDIFNSFKKVAPSYADARTIEGLEAHMNYSIWSYLPRILNMPLLFVIIEGDTPMYPLQIDAYNRVPSPQKKCHVLPSEYGKVKHMTFYADNTYTKRMAKPEADFLEECLVKPFK